MDAASEPEGLTTPAGAAPIPHGRQGGSLDVRLVRRLITTLGNPPIEFVLAWTGELIAGQATAPVAHVRIADRATLLGLLSDPRVRFGDAYSAGSIEVEGDLVQLMEIIYRAFPSGSRAGSMSRRLAGWLQRPRRNTLSGSRSNIHRHYDLGNEFYSLWLGETMSYTCAYFPSAEASLELHMASRYGARVRAFNISNQQIRYARSRAREQGLENLVEFIEDDYRNISGRYDVFTSVGMLEHVGRENYAELGRVARRSLSAEGRGLIHSTGPTRPEPLHPWIERRIFPGAYAPTLGEMM